MPLALPVNNPLLLCVDLRYRPALVVPDAKATECFFELFTANMRNKPSG